MTEKINDVGVEKTAGLTSTGPATTQTLGTLDAKPTPPPMGGYNGKILRVNLSKMSLSDEPMTYEIARKYIGGAGFVAYFLWKELKGGEDALGPQNKLIFALGPVTGLTLPGASRYCVGAKSPLTGGIAKSESGGFWMAELKRSGYDVLIFEGKAERPTYLWINDGQAVLKEASQLWGKEIKETQSTLRNELNDQRIQVAAIGPAGENLVRYACIMTGLFDACGRGGLGAVMGSKNLKAIAVRGHKLPEIANPEYIKTLRQTLVSHPHHLSQYGTGGPEMNMHEQDGDLPVRNQRDGLFPNVKLINGETIKNTIRVRMDGCFACNVRCKKVVKFSEPYTCDEDYGGPEYETLGALGSNCGIDNLKAICKGNERCNALGLDTISVGSSMAFAMECYEKGLINQKDTGGMELKFGDAEVMLRLLEMVALRQGIGNTLAEGTARMVDKFGNGSKRLAVSVKGLDAAMHDARAKMGFRIGYMLNPHGADHCSSMGGGTSLMGLSQLNQFGILTPVKEDFGPQRMSLFKLNHCFSILNDCMVLCLMPNINPDQKVELMKSVTGWNTGWVELLQIAERVLTTMRLFNNREGFTDADDELPDRYYERKTDGVLSTKDPADKVTMARARKLYYYYMGWDAYGIPTPETIARLAI
jgi:aldehyde:ferredoxin oxidoreductase